MEKGYYPIALNILGRTCIVIGGGLVAARKVNALLEHGARVTVVSPSCCDELRQLSEEDRIHLVRKDFTPEDIQEAFLVIAATDQNQINERVAQEARKRKILINVVDNAALSDFVLPASLYRGNLTVSVSTDGLSPALARKIRDYMGQSLGPEYGILTELIAEIRSEIKNRNIIITSADWQKALDLELLIRLLKSGQREKARVVVLQSLTGQQII
jgi:precorrin-2 dehydrogenase / sirohydrochlorin ferrochelatase